MSDIKHLDPEVLPEHLTLDSDAAKVVVAFLDWLLVRISFPQIPGDQFLKTKLQLSFDSSALNDVWKKM